MGFALYIVCMVFVLLLALGCAIWCCRRSKADGDEVSGKGRRGSTPCYRKAPSQASSNSLTESASMPRSSVVPPCDSGAPPSESGLSMPRSSMVPPSESEMSDDYAGAQGPLCKMLIVPEGTLLACLVQNDVCRKKQDLFFNIRGMHSRTGAGLFQIRVSEHGTSRPGIHVDSLGGKEQLAFLSTAELWRGTVRPTLRISRPSGELYGSIRKNTSGEYIVQRGELDMWVLSGDFVGHSVQISSMSEQLVASVCPGTLDEYQVYVQARIDAGLLILCMVAIDKCETDPRESF